MTPPLEKKEGGNEEAKTKKYIRPQCSFDGCTHIVVCNGVCNKHGAKRKICSSDGCANIAQKGGVCKKHGAKTKKYIRPQCSFDGCTHIAVSNGVCNNHGAKRKICSSDGCANIAQEGGVCKKHGAKTKKYIRPQCSFDGCTHIAVSNGVCNKHGAKRKICSSDGCTNIAQKGGVCKRHRVKEAKGIVEVENDNTNNNSNQSDDIDTLQDAEREEVGRSPRANSTDGELKLSHTGLCDESSVIISHKWDLNRLYNCDGPHHLTPPQGLVNLGNTCYLNAVLQCLVHVPSFCQSIIDLPPNHYKSNNGRTLRDGQSIAMLLQSLASNAHGIKSREKNVPQRTDTFEPAQIATAIFKINGHRFSVDTQEDAQELLVYLLDEMHEEELFAAGIDSNASGWRDELPRPRLDETTFVHRIFGGHFRDQVVCNECGYESNKYDPFLSLSLEISEGYIRSLSSALEEFTREETLDMDNQWKCHDCKKHVCSTKRLSVFRPPLSLCIHLKRFGFDGRGRASKIKKRINFPVELSLPLSDDRVCDYTLTGIIVHVGDTATSGHYTACVKQPGDSSTNWYHMDDSDVTEVSEKIVLRKYAYMLFYTRKEVELEIPQSSRVGEQQSDAKQA